MTEQMIVSGAVVISFYAVKLTAKVLAKAFLAIIKKIFSVKPGKHRLNTLIKNGAIYDSVALENKAEIADFNRLAKKYEISYSLMKQQGTDRFNVFLQAKDPALLKPFMQDYVRQKLSPSHMLSKLTRSPAISKTNKKIIQDNIQKVSRGL